MHGEETKEEGGEGKEEKEEEEEEEKEEDEEEDEEDEEEDKEDEEDEQEEEDEKDEEEEEDEAKRREGRGGRGGGSLSKIWSEETLSKLRLKLNQNKAHPQNTPAGRRIIRRQDALSFNWRARLGRLEMPRAWSFPHAFWRRSWWVPSLRGTTPRSRQKTQIWTSQLALLSRLPGLGEDHTVWSFLLTG